MREKKRVLTVNLAEYRLLWDTLLQLRNRLLQEGRCADPVNELLIKLSKS